ncbi:MAG: cyclase family protein [Candidatus Kuenenia stuttgartiensis]|nr:cyclase family protein [uncultured Candidatus Kuenenia sp.]MBZ0192428.1 cyclase family protein [Candidatus Kuenenia stuttgartiensis]MCL4726289.1 cyclase family protein [Candidatus Kuenenia stuttgartiensis]
MTFYDVTVPISNAMITWPSDPAVSITGTSLISRGDFCNLSELKIGSHCGTHIDAPSHFLENGRTIDQLALENLIGEATVFEFKHKENIDVSDIKQLRFDNVKRVLFKTVNSSYWKFSTFKKDFVYLTKDAAQYLVDKGIRLVGVDYLSVEKFESQLAETHHTLLRNDVIILEGLDLSNVERGRYELIALPLKIKDGDGSPARVVLKST